MILHELPYKHPLRNTPLGEINAQCRCVPAALPDAKPGAWRDVKTWRIASATYNQLGGAWTAGCSEFRAGP